MDTDLVKIVIRPPAKRTTPPLAWDGEPLEKMRQIGGHWHLPPESIVTIGVKFETGACVFVDLEDALDIVATPYCSWMKDCPSWMTG